MKALVTGGSGFVGSHLVLHLVREGWNVSVARHGGALSGAESILAMLRDAAPDAVFHMAGLTRAEHPAALYEANAVLTAHLLEAVARQPRPPVIVLAGSAAEYGSVPPDAVPVQETQPCRPITDYAISKYAQTLMGLTRAAAGLPVVVARLWNPVGPGMPQHLALGSFAAQIATMPVQGGTLHVGNLGVQRDFLDVREAVRLVAALAIRPNTVGLVVNICSGRTWGLHELVHTMIRLAGRHVSVVVDPARIRPGELPVLSGHTGRLASLNLTPAPPDFGAILPEMLVAAAANQESISYRPELSANVRSRSS